jgi:hypothetical protein
MRAEALKGEVVCYKENTIEIFGIACSLRTLGTAFDSISVRMINEK